jgi:hypothetical protein
MRSARIHHWDIVRQRRWFCSLSARLAVRLLLLVSLDHPF